MRRSNEWFRPGELARTVLDILRVAPAPLAIREITAQVTQRRGIDLPDARPDARSAERLRKLVTNALTRQAAGRVERLQDGSLVTWRVRE